MADRYVLRGSLHDQPIPPEPFGSLEAALDRARDLFCGHGSEGLQLQIYLNDLPPPLYDTQFMRDWTRGAPGGPSDNNL